MSGLKSLVAASADRTEAIFAAFLDKKLPQDMIEGLQDRTGNSTACVQLFLCKLSPLVWSVQDTAENSILDYRHSLTANAQHFLQKAWLKLPDLKRMSDVAPECEERFPACPLVDFAKLF